ncbi:MAG: DUF4332 domain-containing protein [Cyanobacteria bacterium J06643_13]
MKSQYCSIEFLPGLGASDRNLLNAQGIENTQELLQRTKTQAAKVDLASRLKLHQKHLSKWIALADLARIPSVGTQYCGLLLHAGIISVAQLAQTPFQRLHRQVSRLQVATVRRQDLIPPVTQVKQWVEQAQVLSNRRL